MAASGSPPWMRRNVTIDDSVWQKDVSGQVKYPPLRFLSRHTPCQPDYPENGQPPSATGVNADDGGSDVSVSSADTVIAAPSLADKLTNDVRFGVDRRHADAIGASYGETVSKNSTSSGQWMSRDYVDHVVNGLPLDEAMRTRPAMNTTDNDSALPDEATGCWEREQTGSTSYCTMEYAYHEDHTSNHDQYSASDEHYVRNDEDNRSIDPLPANSLHTSDLASENVDRAASDKLTSLPSTNYSEDVLDFRRTTDRNGAPSDRQEVKGQQPFGSSSRSVSIRGESQVNTANRRPLGRDEPRALLSRQTARAPAEPNDQRPTSEAEASGQNERTTVDSSGRVDSTISAERAADFVTRRGEEGVEIRPYERPQPASQSTAELPPYAVLDQRWTSPVGGALSHSEYDDDEVDDDANGRHLGLPTPVINNGESSAVCWPRPDSTLYDQRSPVVDEEGLVINDVREEPTNRCVNYRDETLKECKHADRSACSRNELANCDAELRMKPSETGRGSGASRSGIGGGGILPEAAVNNRLGMPGMRRAGQTFADYNSDTSPSRSASVEHSSDGSRLLDYDMERDEGIGEEVVSRNGTIGHQQQPSVAAVQQQPSVAAVQQAEIGSDNSSVDSEGTPCRRKKSALKNAASSSSSLNKDGARRVPRKVRFAEPLVVRDHQPSSTGLSARERLGLAKDGSASSGLTLGTGTRIRPRIEQKGDTDTERVDGGRTATPRFIVKRGPPVRRLYDASSVRHDNPDDVHGALRTVQGVHGNVDGVRATRGGVQELSSSSQPVVSTPIRTESSSGQNGHLYDEARASGEKKETVSRSGDPEDSFGVRDDVRETWYGENIAGNGTASSYRGIVDRTSTADDNASGNQSTSRDHTGASPSKERNPGGDIRPNRKVNLSRSTPIRRNRPKPSPELRRRPSSPPGRSTYDQSVRGETSAGDLLTSTTGNGQIPNGFYVRNSPSPERDSSGHEAPTGGVPAYAKLGQKVLPSAVDLSQLRRVNGSGRRDQVANGSVGANVSGSRRRVEDCGGRFSGSVPDLAVIAPQTADSPSVPSPVSGDSGISSSSSVTDLNRDQSPYGGAVGIIGIADSLTGGYNAPNYARNDETKSSVTRIRESVSRDPRTSGTESTGRCQFVAGGSGITDHGDRNRPRGEVLDQKAVVRRPSNQSVRRGPVASAIENGGSSDLDRWSLVLDTLTRDDAGVRYSGTCRQPELRQDPAGRDITSLEGQSSPERRKADKGRGVYGRARYSDDASSPPEGAFTESASEPDEENPYGRFLRSATNRKSTRGRLVPIPMDILNPRAASQTTGGDESLNQPYIGGGSGDSRRLSNSSGYGTRDASYDLGPGQGSRSTHSGSPGLLATSGSRPHPDYWNEDTRSSRSSLACDQNEPRFTTSAQIYQLLREKSRNPFVKTNAFS